MKKRTKKYRPKEVSLDPVSWAMAGAHTFPIETVNEIMQISVAAFEKMRRGEADRDDWNMIAQPLNVSQALAGLNIGANLMPQIIRGQEALEQLAKRMQQRKTSTCYMSELDAIHEALVMHKVQLKVCTQAEYSRALRKVKNTIRSGGSVKMEKLYSGMAVAA